VIVTSIESRKRNDMRSYDPSIPRVPLAFAALAMTAVSLGLLIVWPAEVDGLEEGGYWTASRFVTTASAGLIGGIASDDDGDEATQPASSGVKCTDSTPKG
jgi:hypothetical protein